MPPPIRFHSALLSQHRNLTLTPILNSTVQAGRWYQLLVLLTTRTTTSITGTSTSTPTTVASAAPDSTPKRLTAVATASSKKLDAPISADGQATLCFSPSFLLS